MEKKIIEFRGKKYKSVNKLAEEVGIPSYTLNHRLRQGMSLEDAVSVGIREKRVLEYEGVEYKSIEDLAKYVGMGANILVNRLQKGMTVVEAVETPVKKRGKKTKRELEYRGIKFSSIAELAKHVNVKTSTLVCRLRKGMTVDEAVETPMRKSNKKTN